MHRLERTNKINQRQDSYFNKDSVFTIRKKQTIDGIMYYWIKSTDKKLSTRFQRSELFAIKSHFL